jgi:hypothetical protein
MRALAVPLALAVIAAIILMVVLLTRGAGHGKSPEPTRWVVGTELKDGTTRVFIRHLAGERELGRQVVREIAADAEDWEVRYHEAVAEARSRAAALTSEST